MCSLAPRLFLYGRGEKGEGRKGLVNNSTPMRIHGILTVSCEGVNTYNFIVPHKCETMCPHYTFIQNVFTTHTYLTFAFSPINTDGRKAAVEVQLFIHQTLTSLAFLASLIQEGSGNQTSLCGHYVRTYQVQLVICVPRGREMCAPNTFPNTHFPSDSRSPKQISLAYLATLASVIYVSQG